MKSTINLLPKKNIQEKAVQRKRQFIAVLAVIIALVIAVSWLVPYLFLQNLKARERELISQVSQREKDVSLLSDTETLYRTVFNRARAVAYILQNQEKFAKDIETIRGLVQKDTAMEGMSLNKGNVDMKVSSLQTSAIFAYLRKLESDEMPRLFSELTINGISIDKFRGYDVKTEGILLP